MRQKSQKNTIEHAIKLAQNVDKYHIFFAIVVFWMFLMTSGLTYLLLARFFR